ncbi:MAG: 4-hydroxy-tetrahydrodipicolinate synthase [Clostridiales bacterium]|nr:4-hydroxy-tetrahydrodipicolinate synthase [Clostridiales bacterium]
MKKTVFKGAATALITPFDENGINYEQFGKIIDWQIESGINGLVVCGTTGEASTMTDDEHREAIAFTVKRAAGRVPVIAGTGSNDTAYCLDLIKCAEEAGADAALTVTPYYNKATQRGLVEMFTKLADYSKIPIILYNIPSRTGVNIEPETIKILAEHENIVGIKEAGGNLSKIVETMSYVHGKLDLYSGNDDQIVPLLALGGQGVISVISNLLPAETAALCDKFFAGDIEGAAKMQYQYHALIDALFSEVNPIPVKAAMAAMGFCENRLRLPLTTMDKEKEQKLLAIMRTHGLNV